MLTRKLLMIGLSSFLSLVGAFPSYAQTAPIYRETACICYSRAFSAAWSNDGTKFAVGTLIGTRVYTADGTETAYLPHPATAVGGLAWSPDDKRLAVTAIGLRIWDVEAKTLVEKIDNVMSNEPLTQPWSPKGDKLLFTAPAAGRNQTQLVVRDLISKQTSTIISDVDPFVQAVWSAEGQYIAFSYSKNARSVFSIWNTTERRNIFTAEKLFPSTWSSDGKTLVLQDFISGQMELRNSADFARAQQTIKFQKPIARATWTDRGITLAVPLETNATELWLWTGSSQDEALLLGEMQAQRVWVSPKGDRGIAIDASTGLSLFSLPSLQTIKAFPEYNLSAQDLKWLASDDGLLLTSQFYGVTRWNGLTQSATRLFTQKTRQIAASHSDTLVAYISDTNDNISNKIIVRSLENNQIIQSLSVANVTTRQITWSYDNKFLAAATSDNIIRIWDVSTGEIVRSASSDGTVVALAFSPTENMLVVLNSNDEVSLWIDGSASLVKVFSSKEYISSLAWSPDGKTLALVRPSNDVIVWDVGQSKIITTLRYSNVGPNTVAWRNEHELAVAFADVIIFDISLDPARYPQNTSSRILSGIDVASDLIVAMAWDSSGTQLATAGNDSTVRIFKAINGE